MFWANSGNRSSEDGGRDSEPWGFPPFYLLGKGMGPGRRLLLHSSATLFLTVSDTRERKEGRATDGGRILENSIKEKVQTKSWFSGSQFWDLGH